MMNREKSIIYVFCFVIVFMTKPVITSGNDSHVIISEFMAVNTNTWLDGENNYSDWLEIYNPTDQAVTLNAWYLTDDLSQLTKWRFPSSDMMDLTLWPGDYLIVFASGNGASGSLYLDDLAYLHCNFKLSSRGEDLALIQPDGQTVVHQYSEYPNQFNDIAYGFGENENKEGYFLTPTPGDGNSLLYEGCTDDTKFTHDRGFYYEPFDLEITTSTEGAQIRYTLDGSEPTEENGMLYTSPLHIENTTVLRAAAFKESYIPSNIDTQTYLFLSDIIVQSPDGEAPGENWPSPTDNTGSGDDPNQGGQFPGMPNRDRPGDGGGIISGESQAIDYGMDPDIVNDPEYGELIMDALLAIPSISIVTALDNLFDSSTGIYMNAQQDGREWERPVSLELLNPEDSKGFQVNAGLRIRGGSSRSGNNPKHNFRLLFRSEYGDANLNFPLFDEEGVDEFDKIDLRTGQNFSWAFSNPTQATWLYDVFTRDTEGTLGKIYTRSRFCHLYINGQYWGLYQTEERPEANYGASYLGGEAEDYDTIKADSDDGAIYAVDGNLDAYDLLWEEISRGMTNNEDYFRIQGLAADGLTENPEYPKYLDVDTLIDFMLVIYYTGNRDCPIGPPSSGDRSRNMYGIFNRNTPDGFQFITHDNEWTLLTGESSGFGQPTSSDSGLNVDRVNVNLGSSFNEKTNFNPWWMHNQLMEDNQEYRLCFADHVYKHFFNNGSLTAAHCAERFELRKDEIDLAIIAESARWGDYQSPDDPYTKEEDWLPLVTKNLNEYILASPSTRTDIVFNQIKAKGWHPDIEPPVYNQHGGEVASGFSLSIFAAEGDVYYTLDGSDPRLPGGEINPNATLYSGETIFINQSTRVLARVFVDQEWSPLAEASFTVSAHLAQSLRITEIHYHPSLPNASEQTAGFDDEDDFEFIELINTSDEFTLDLANVRFVDGIQFTFNADDFPLLSPGQSILLVQNRSAFECRYGGGYALYGEYEGKLSNGGENVQLIDSDDNIILEFEYQTTSPWPEEPDGQGSSLQIIDVNGDYDDPTNWKASVVIHGTPALEADHTTQVGSWMLY